MPLLSKRESPIQNIAYMAIMSAINVIFVLLSNILPLLLFLLIFVLPLTSAIVTIYCKKKCYPIYFIVTLALCILVSYGFSIFDTLVYVLPSLIVGFIFGVCFDFEMPAIITIFCCTIVQFVLTLLTFFIMEKIVINISFMDTLVNAFGLGSFQYKNAFSYMFVFIISQIQIVLSYIFIKLQLKRLSFDINLKSKYRFLLYTSTILTCGMAVFSYFLKPEFTIVFVLMPLMIYVFELIDLIMKKKKLIYILLGAAHFIFVFLFAFLYRYVNTPNQFILIYILFGSVTIIDFLDNYCFIKNRNNIK